MSFYQKGYSLVELIVAITIITFLGLAMFNLYFSITKAITFYRERATISSLANNYLEIARNMDYSKLGTINGNPAGNLPDLQNPLTVVADKYSYQIYYVVNTISNDPVGNPGSQDYKQVKLYIKELKNNTTNTFTTSISPTNVYAGNVGSLAISAYDASGLPLSGFNIHIVNTNITPNINLCRLTDISGAWNEAGLPCSNPRGNACTTSGLTGYQVTANDIACPNYQASYSVDKTYSVTPTTATPPDATIYYNQATYLDFQIDKLSNLTYTILDGMTEDCDPKSGVGLEVRGAKKIRILPDVYKYDKYSGGGGLSLSNAAGKIALSNIEWDTYTSAVRDLTNTYMIYGSSPTQPFFLEPNKTQNINLVVGPYSANNLLVTVKDVITKNPIDGATVNLGGTEKTTGQVLSCTDVSQTPGQAMFAGLTAGSFSLTVNASGYDEKTISPLNISGYSTLTVELVPTGGSTPTVTHIIKASIGTSGGTISPSGNVAVADGSNKTFSIAAKAGFYIGSVLVDGVSQGAISTYTFTNITADHTISATFTSESNTCSPPGITQPCAGGVQTCGSDGTWGTCQTTIQYACKISPLVTGQTRNWSDPTSWTDCNSTFPQTGDSVSATATSGNLVVNVTTNSLTSFDLTNYIGILSGGSSVIVAPASSTVSVYFSSTMTQNWTGYLYLRPATGATINFTTNGKLMRGIIVDSGKGTVQQQDDIAISSYGFNLNSNGTIWNTNNHNITLSTASYFYAYNGATLNFGTATVFLSPSAATTIYTSATNKFYNLSITGGALTTAYVQLYADTAVTNNFSVAGANNTTQRLFFVSSTLGTQRRITVSGTTGNSYSNVDFRDIDLYSSGGKVDLSNIAGLSGDCGGNNSTDMTLTTPADQHWIKNPAAVGNWSDPTNWTSRVPLCQDNVYMDYRFAANKSVLVDVARPGATIDWSGSSWSSGTLTWTWGSIYPYICGSLTLKNGMTLGAASYYPVMAGRGAYTLKTDGVTITSGIQFNMGAGAIIGAGTGSVAIQDNLTLGLNGNSGKYLYVNSGTITNPNNSTIKMSYFSKSGGSLTLCNGACTWYLANTSTSAVTIWNTNGTNALLNTTGSTIDISNNASPSGTINDTLTLYGLSYNNLIIHGDSGTKGIAFGAGNNTFTGIFTIDGKKTVIFPQGSTQTVANFSGNGSAGNLVTIKSTMSGQGLPGACSSNLYFTFTKTGGGVILPSNYLSLQDSYATPANTWHAGNNSVDIPCGDGIHTSNNGWIFP